MRVGDVLGLNPVKCGQGYPLLLTVEYHRQVAMQFIHIYNNQHFSNLIGMRGIFESGREISANSTLYPSNV